MLGARLLLNHKMIHVHCNTRCFLSDNQCDVMCSAVNLLQKQPYNDVTDTNKRLKVVFMSTCGHTSSTMSMTAGVLLGSGIVKLSVTICLTKSMTCLRAAWVLSDTASKRGTTHVTEAVHSGECVTSDEDQLCVHVQYVYCRSPNNNCSHNSFSGLY